MLAGDPGNVTKEDEPQDQVVLELVFARIHKKLENTYICLKVRVASSVPFNVTKMV